MKNRFFVDESWSPDGASPSFGLLSGILVEEETLEKLENFLFLIRKKYYGKDHARDYTKDIKGKDLLSNYMIKLWAKNGTMPNNICIAKEMLTFPILNKEIFFKSFASFIFSENSTKPDLLSPDPKRLSIPIRNLIENVSEAAQAHRAERQVKLVFDQRLGSQEGLAISMKHFIAGTGLSNIHPYPYFAVSNISPGVQFADVFAYLLAKQAQGFKEVQSLYHQWRESLWQSEEGASVKKYGLNSWTEQKNNGERNYAVRRPW
ncbi:MAG TPA: DUF3800 domain-containing protein [Holophaga sp.]|nr:DUF3800 domain-containing protein [Holophaga sp.]